MLKQFTLLFIVPNLAFRTPNGHQFVFIFTYFAATANQYVLTMTTIVKTATFAFLVLSQLAAMPQVTLTIPKLPANTPKGSEVFLAGSINGWQPNIEHYKFTPNEFGVLSLKIDSVPSEFEYKICRGNWTSVEVDSTGRDITNRIYVDSLGKNITVGIKGWRDRFPDKAKVSTASKNVNFLPTSIEIPQFGKRRTVRVYFPQNYASSQGFPVIYMFDGQNLFDNSTAFAGEWGVDEILDSLNYSKGFSAIVVGIYHGENDRINEQTPWSNLEKKGGDGAKMAQFIVKNLKPYIDKHYRTLPDRENTIIAGSSLGGLMSLYMALEYPEVFGKAMVFSPSLWWSEKSFEQISKFKKRKFQKLYLYAGEKESESMIPNIEKAKGLLKTAGYAENELILNTNPLGKHNEEWWGIEFYNAIKWMYGF